MTAHRQFFDKCFVVNSKFQFFVFGFVQVDSNPIS
jgi:hypothetical protein